MINPKLSLATLTVLLGLAAVSLPHTKFDVQTLAERRAAQQQLDSLDETIRLNRMLLAGGAWDAHTRFNIAQVHLNRNRVIKELYGETPRLLDEYEATYREVCELYARPAIAESRRSEQCPSETQLWTFARELGDLRAKTIGTALPVALRPEQLIRESEARPRRRAGSAGFSLRKK